jgi:hypothetical protein
VETNLRGHITQLEKKSKDREEGKAAHRGHKQMGKNMLKAINEVEKLQGSDADRERVEADLSGQTDELGNTLIKK